MVDQYPITLAEFREWLETKRPRAVVGKRWFPNSCPIARYIKARGDHKYPEVNALTIWAGKKYRTPSWAAEFVVLVDEGRYGGRQVAIQARTALRLLDRAAHATLPEDEVDQERRQLESEAVR